MMIRAQRSNACVKLRVEEDATQTHAPAHARAREKFAFRLQQRRRALMFLISCLLVLCLLVAAGVAAVYLQPRFLINLISRSYPEVLFNVDTSEKIIALTIDDAPTRVETPQILDILKEFNATATFFCIGYNMMYEDRDKSILRRMRDEGHEIGNHMSYDDPSYKLEDAEFKKQFTHVDSLIEEVNAERTTKWFRPGHGFFTRKMLDVVGGFGYKTALGDVYPHDPMIKLPSVNSYYVVNRVHPGAIVILHNRPWTMDALCSLLPQLKEMGYTITTLSGLLKYKQSRLDSKHE